jgi:hypothetical protein
MIVLSITEGSTVGHTTEAMIKLLQDQGFAVFTSNTLGGPKKYIVSHPDPSWVPDGPELSALLNTEPNYMYLIESFTLS